MLAFDGREVAEKLINRIARLEVVEECGNRNARSGEDEGAAHALEVAGDQGRGRH